MERLFACFLVNSRQKNSVRFLCFESIVMKLRRMTPDATFLLSSARAHCDDDGHSSGGHVLAFTQETSKLAIRDP